MKWFHKRERKEYKLKGYIVRQRETATICFSETKPILTGDYVWINGDGWTQKLQRLPIEGLFDSPVKVEITVRQIE
jgi:hypothetical protein